jgi:hypothetical protein
VSLDTPPTPAALDRLIDWVRRAVTLDGPGCKSLAASSALQQERFPAGARTGCSVGGAALGRPFRDVSQPATGNSGPGGSDSEHEAARDLVRF